MFNCPKTTQGIRSFLPVKGKENMVVRYVKNVFGCTLEEDKKHLNGI